MTPARVVFDTSTVALSATPAKVDARGPAAFAAFVAVSERAEVVAPPLLAYELAHVLLVKRPQDFGPAPADRRELLALLLAGVEIVPVTTTDVQRAGVIAAKHRLSVYDASFIACAEAIGATLVTDDARQLAVAAVVLGKARAVASAALAGGAA